MYSDNVLTAAIARKLKTGGNTSIQFTLATTVTGVLYFKSITLPDEVSGLRIYSNAALRLGLSEQPAAASTTTFVIGALLNASEWGQFVLTDGLSRTLQVISSTTATFSVDLYF